MSDNPIYVTRPLLPPLSEFLPYLEQIWESKWLTNGGAFHAELEVRLAQHLGVNHLSLFTNGTIALVTALQALGLRGEVITTPYSFVATAHSLLWNNITPVFVDIDPDTCNLDPARIESAISRQTTAILPVHCYGTPCDVEAIYDIAHRNGLKVIYDAAHAFGVKYKDRSILLHGNLSVLSFHATKVFNTFEGGAIISPDAETKKQIDYLKNFGFADELTVVATGINGKMSEVQAAMGLLQLKYIDDAIQKRSVIEATYRRELDAVPGITMFPLRNHCVSNHSYVPILIGDNYHESRDALYERLRSIGINGRRYFFPLISNMSMYCQMASAAPELLPQANRIANGIMCLPIYPDLTEAEAMRVVTAIRG